MSDDLAQIATRTNAAWRTKYPDRYRDSQLRCKYGISLKEFNLLVEQQGGVCAICRDPPTGRGFNVDHCHLTGEVRGLLCSRCNLMLGKARDNPDLLRKGAEYLEKSSNASRR